MVKVLVLCTHNSARSQMAEAFLRRELAGLAEVHSAGTHPSQLHPYTVAVMQEIGYDLSGHTAKTVEAFAGESWDYVITVCDEAREHCPYLPARHNLHVSFPDPSSGGIEAFRAVRDSIRSWAEAFAQTLRASLSAQT